MRRNRSCRCSVAQGLLLPQKNTCGVWASCSQPHRWQHWSCCGLSAPAVPAGGAPKLPKAPKHPAASPAAGREPPALGRKGAELSFHQIPAPPHVKATILISFQQAVEGLSESIKTTQIPRPGEGRPEEEAGVMPLIRPSDAAGKNGQVGRCRSSKEGLCGLFFFQLAQLL